MAINEEFEQYVDPLRRRAMYIGAHKGVPGVNLDHIDVAAGVAALADCGWENASMETKMVIEYALMRWARGEETAAQRGAIDKSFHGIDLMSWYRVLAAAMAAGQAKAKSAHLHSTPRQ